MVETRQIVVPGEVVDDTGDLRPGMNTYQEGRSIYALRLGVKAVKGDRVNVISLSGRYEPFRGDMVIGTVVELGPSNWYIDIGSANDVGMHVNDVPWRVEFGETSKYLAIGDTVLLKIVHVDEMKKAQVSMKDRQCRKLTGGIIFDVAPTKVPRIVGRNGSMIGMIKDATNVRLFVGQNGHVWLDGEADDVQLALEALRKIEAEAHTTGLTDRMKAWLEERRPTASRVKRAEPEEEAAEAAPAEDRAPRRERREDRPPRADRGDRPRGGEGGRTRDERSRQYRDPEESEGEARVDARPPPRRFEEDRPRAAPRFEEERPRRAMGEERPRRFSEEDRPRRAPEGDRPRRVEEERPRRFEEERPRRFEEDRPRPRPRAVEDDEEPRRLPMRRTDDEDEPRRAIPPRRVVDEDEEPRRPPIRRVADDDDAEDNPPRREGGERSGGGGGDARRRRRGGRGRGRGGRKED